MTFQKAPVSSVTFHGTRTATDRRRFGRIHSVELKAAEPVMCGTSLFQAPSRVCQKPIPSFHNPT
jgi:hypothetical protein